MRDQPTAKCPTCRGTSRGRYVYTMTRKKAMRLVRKGKAELAGTNTVGMGTQRVAIGESFRRNYRSLSPSKSYVRCLDDFHILPEPACQDKCVWYDAIPHWHEDGEGRFKCIEVCRDPETKETYFEDAHYHLRADLPRQHDIDNRRTKAILHKVRQAKDKR